MERNKSVVILYHENCPDGFGAAWAAWMKFKNKATYIATEPHVFPQEEFKGREIYIVDNSFDKKTLEKLISKNKKVVVLDHHKSAQADVEAFPQNVFDNNHSGAVLSWNYFHPKKKIPMLLRYVEDGDLWHFKLPNTEYIRSYIYAHSYDFSVWSKLSKELENTKTRKQGIEKGKAINDYFDQIVDELVKKADRVRLGSFSVFAVNSSSKKVVSKIGHVLAERTKSFGIVWYISNGMLYVSLRSVGSFDVSKIVARFGGGGHKNAAGFCIPFLGKFPWKRIKT